MLGRLLVLEYHRVADDGPNALRSWRTSPAEFTRQMTLLSELRIPVCTPGEWLAQQRPRPDAISITFDDGYADFAEVAWPILRRLGLVAEVYLPTAHVGGVADWDAHCGPPARLMGWSKISRLSKEGVRFGSHSHRHVPLTALSETELLNELTAAKSIIEDALNIEAAGLAYPYGCHSAVARRIAAEIGYKYAVTVSAGIHEDHDDRFTMPRFEVLGDAPPKVFEQTIANFASTSPNR